MKKTAKILSLLMAVAIVFTVSLVPAEAASKGYAFRYKNATTYIDAKAAPFIRKAGRYNSRKKSTACAFKGEEYTYSYKDFDLITYSNKKGGTDYVESIEFKNSRVKTDKGIRIGSNDRTVRKAYGGSVKNGWNNYKKGSMVLKIKVQNHKVSKITYIKR